MNQIDLFAGADWLPAADRTTDRIVTFGKFKGQPFEALLQDASYAMWLMSSMYAKLQLQHPGLLAFLVCRYGFPERTPEHNKLQNRFLDDEFALRFAIVANRAVESFCRELAQVDVRKSWAYLVERAFQAVLDEPEQLAWNRRPSWLDAGDKLERLDAMRRVLSSQAKLPVRVAASGSEASSDGVCRICQIAYMQFEAEGADVEFRCAGSLAIRAPAIDGAGPLPTPLPGIAPYLMDLAVSELFRVEVKPLVGDDYPAILRAMKAVKSRQLLVGEYNGTSATWAEVVKVFRLSRIEAVLLRDVEAMTLPPETQRLPIREISAEDAESIVKAAFAEAAARLTGNTEKSARTEG